MKRINLTELKENILDKGYDLKEKAKEIGMDAMEWCVDHPRETVVIAGVLFETINSVHNAHVKNEYMKAETRSKNAYADKFGK